MLNCSDLGLRRGQRLLFSGATFNIFRGEKVGITGANGCGKSSLLSLVRAELTPDAGSLIMPPGLALAYVAQELPANDAAAIDMVLDGDAQLRELQARLAAAGAHPGAGPGEAGPAGDSQAGAQLAELHARYAQIGGYEARSRAGRLMAGLGFAAADELQPVSSFSGGWRVRLALARALMCRSDLLLLDEPTNHLDLDAILWLEGWLRGYPGTLLLITHDREFLDRIADRILHIEHQQVHAYRGNYSAFEQQRASELSQQAALYTRQQREIRHMESFIERFRAKASKARQAQSRLKALERLRRIAPAHVDVAVEFAFAIPDKLPRPLLSLERQAAGYDGRVLISGVTLTLAPGDRVALLGRNGAGKSTVMKLLAGVLPVLAGERTAARELRIGYFAQHQLEQLDGTQSAFEHLRRCDAAAGGRAAEQGLRDFLASFGFSGERVFEPVAPYSGGEKARLVLALLAYQRPNLLLLDEPTNHLDLQMRQALAVALQDYPGAVVLVSHDRHLLRVVADQLLLVHAGQALPFDGDLEDYAAWSAGTAPVPSAPALSAPPAPCAPSAPSESAQGRRQRRQEGAEQRRRIAPLRATIAQHERELERLTAARALTEQALSQPQLHSAAGKPRLLQLLQEQASLVRAIEQVEAAWLAASEQLEAAEERAPADPPTALR
ncbi:MAG TPA: ATP-binding cassette domain-containing protein [Steroidobacteraceae bacterium]|jgi:ATP-binding cassette subfamily F protein 3|nr:ATP-binding cassette domain-containing protein [Steroidobacteraceae bacterium]